MITEMSKALAHVEWYGPAEQTLYEQQEIVKDFFSKWLKV